MCLHSLNMYSDVNVHRRIDMLLVAVKSTPQGWSKGNLTVYIGTFETGLPTESSEFFFIMYIF